MSLTSQLRRRQQPGWVWRLSCERLLPQGAFTNLERGHTDRASLPPAVRALLNNAAPQHLSTIQMATLDRSLSFPLMRKHLTDRLFPRPFVPQLITLISDSPTGLVTQGSPLRDAGAAWRRGRSGGGVSRDRGPARSVRRRRGGDGRPGPPAPPPARRCGKGREEEAAAAPPVRPAL